MKFFKVLGKILIIILASVGLILASLWSYQELSNLNEYSYVSLWNFKTREKVFEKEGKRVYLVGMIHVAEESYYTQIIEEDRYQDSEKVITLMEGLSHKSKGKDPRPSSFNYVDISSMFGLAPQGNFDKQFPNVVHADMDYSDLSKDTMNNLKVLDLLMKNVVLYMKKEMSYKQMEEFLSSKEISLEKVSKGLEEEGLMRKEIIFKRNDHLWKVFKEKQNEYQVFIIPWGAEHLLDIESRLLKEGFKEVKTRRYQSLNILSVGYKALPIFWHILK